MLMYVARNDLRTKSGKRCHRGCEIICTKEGETIYKPNPDEDMIGFAIGGDVMLYEVAGPELLVGPYNLWKYPAE